MGTYKIFICAWASIVACGCMAASENAKCINSKDAENCLLAGRTEADSKYEWYDARLFGIDGKGWADTDGFYGRLPEKAKETVRQAIWELGKQSAGLSVKFATDSNTIVARWRLKNKELALPHKSALGVSGLDMYVRDHNRWRNIGIGIPTKFPLNEEVIVQNKRPGMFEYMMYLPLLNVVESLEIGIESQAKMYKIPAEHPQQKAIVFYGSSIVQGICASRPAMTYSAILGRRLDMPVVNLGFSGNAKIEPEMADLLSELDPAVYMIDPVPNINADEINTRFANFVKKIRSMHAQTPIIICETICEPHADYIPWLDKRVSEQCKALRLIYETLVNQGVKEIYYIDRATLIGTDGETFADLGHPTDLGFMRMADAIEPVLKKALKRAGN